MRATVLCLCAMPLFSATPTPPPASARLPECRAAAADTVDVPLGSPLVSGEHMSAFTTHLAVTRVTATGEAPQQDGTNAISFADSGGVRLVRVRSLSRVTTPNGPADVRVDFAFDRRSLALREMRSTSPRGEMRLRAESDAVDVTMPTPAGPRSARLVLSTPGFYAPWSDFVVEELPHVLGRTYRLRLWQPAPGPDGPTLREETHLYTFAAREDVEVFGRTQARAWVVEDHGADGALLGRMWIVDGAPKLVRWTILNSDGSSVRIDQELAREP
ncbi:hypothetical protein J421_4902 (plasmid) [Gemmatirosa kalamazoonensis]|uniref:DUF3108 domain-containing protein n=1 Tax=Gemmatirosa kalamazoonensis TaxID=861299 RepID=W0RPM1_9BACT|nr:hypothetical protein [Gemmatirosa kalamazoonensis]AHG92437.1 hypothetical protein J421_4902 [Gemmatirosa kalamazoonensis]